MELQKVIGLMSGTSLDGVDAAMIETDGVTVAAFGPSVFVPYSTADQATLRAAFGLWQDGEATLLAEAEQVLHNRHVEAVRSLPKADLIGFHGQTLMHDPANGRTHQLGDGQRLADATDTQVVWDFRTQDMRLGGQGAPLVPFFHHALARRLGGETGVAFLNIGGVANMTFVNDVLESPETPGALLAFDTGPGNAILNDFMQQRAGRPFDQFGEQAAHGQADQDMVARWMADDYFARRPPKSLDRNYFHRVLQDVGQKGTENGAATLTAFTSKSIAASFRYATPKPDLMLVAGGGRLNAEMMRMLRQDCPVAVKTVDDLGLDGDMLEAQAFAFLASRVLRGLPTSAPGTTGVKISTFGGRISRKPGQY